jgi:uncharacterized protein (DUF2147 family)
MVLFQHATFAQADIRGKWKSFDDETLEAKSVVDIFEKDGRYYGKVVKLFRKPEEDPDPICKECAPEDPRFNKKVIGMEILRDMKKVGDEFSEGTILDPKNGKIYKCKIWIEGQDLKLRGYWGPFYRTQTWKKAD